ncbi:hypothetical protein [Xanthobacter agilis]|uniref:Uncharacterized protein n=1 Tax=Xanthobacter agilis TaxID=47492 RepID=A0ABU0LDX8_XANAG|nr:hypothetical protein [Xanthobacter agilis]MDQ0505344.1 hypothetical protein [Xanthobacter agilis]
MRGFFRPLACALLLASAWPAAAAADALSDYVAARDQAIAASLAAAKAHKSGDDAIIKRETAAMKDLSKRLTAVLGPMTFKALGSPTYTLNMLTYDEITPTRQLDGISFANADYTTRLVVTPEPVFNAWLAARAKDDDAPPALGAGPKAAMATNAFYNDALVFDGGYFQPYLELPITTTPGEKAYAVLGLQIDEAPGNALPDDIAILRIANGKAMVGLTSANLDIKPIAACNALWKPHEDKAAALTKVVEKDNKPEDPRWNDIQKILDEGSTAFRTCFAKEAPSQPFYAAAVGRAEAFLKAISGN